MPVSSLLFHGIGATVPTPIPWFTITLSLATELVQYYKYSSPVKWSWHGANKACHHYNMTLPTPANAQQWRTLTNIIGDSSLMFASRSFLGAYAVHHCNRWSKHEKKKEIANCQRSHHFACQDPVFRHKLWPTPIRCSVRRSTWFGARITCQSEGSELATSENVNGFLCRQLYNVIWVNDPEDYSYYWENGTTARFSEEKRLKTTDVITKNNIKDGFDTIHTEYIMLGGDGLWYTAPEELTLNEFLCQKDAVEDNKPEMLKRMNTSDNYTGVNGKASRYVTMVTIIMAVLGAALLLAIMFGVWKIKRARSPVVSQYETIDYMIDDIESTEQLPSPPMPPLRVATQ